VLLLLGSVITASFAVLLSLMLAHRKAQYAGVMLSKEKYRISLKSCT